MIKGTLVAVGGPTASGKTSAAIEIARALQTEVISADSRQFYKEMSIGTARPSSEEMAEIPHHFVGHLSVKEQLNAGDFGEQALVLAKTLIDRTGFAVVVGGSGLYMDALCYGLDDLPKTDPRIRKELQDRMETEGIESLVKELRELDPISVESIDIQNPHRLMRAIEVSRIAGKPFSSLKSGRRSRPEFELRKLALDWERQALYARINLRVDQMVETGLVEEVRKLLPHRELRALNTVGYKEIFDAIDGLCSMEQAIEKIKQHTRNYAKRQVTWMRRDSDQEWIKPENIGTFVESLRGQR